MMIAALATRCLRSSSVRLVSYKARHVAPTSWRLLSSVTPTNNNTNAPATSSSTTTAVSDTEFVVSPPTEVTQEMAVAIQGATFMYIRYGLGGQRLIQISEEERRVDNLVHRWQKMMEAFFGTQVHVLAGLGYPPSEQGLGLYNQHLAQFLQRADPTVQEKFRIMGRDLWRLILTTAFDLDPETIPTLSIVDARNIMHRISEKMQDQAVLDLVAERAANAPKLDNPNLNQAYKHHILQDVLVSEVYLGGNPGLVQQCGFGAGEEGYVKLQYAMADHQGDPLVAQYIGAGMMKLIQAAEVDMEMLQNNPGAAPTP